MNLLNPNSYGFINKFRDAPLMRGQVYRFDPDTGAVRVVATDFDKPNGIAFTADGRTAYMSVTFLQKVLGGLILIFQISKF